MDREDPHREDLPGGPDRTPLPPPPPTGAEVLRPTLILAEWNAVLACVAKGPIETHLDLFMKLKNSLASELQKGSAP